MTLEFTFTNDRPIYIQLVEQLEHYIISGQFSPGGKLPSVRDLATHAKVNPNTMQRALQELEEKHLIITERTNGKFVTSDAEYIHLQRHQFIHQKVTTFIDDMRQLGFSHQEILHIFKKSKRKD